MPDPPSRPSLRDAQRDLTQRRIVGALVELIEDEHPLEISMAAVAARAGISEPTLYRHFPTKRDLFAALAGYEFHTVAAGVAPSSLAEMSDALRTVFARSAQLENPIRWTLAAPDPARVPRPNVSARLAMLRTALQAELGGLDGASAELALRAVLLLTSPMAWLYWKDYLGLDPDQAAATANWAIQAMTQAHPRQQSAARRGPTPRTDRQRC